MLDLLRRKKDPNRILVLIDWDNIVINTLQYGPHDFSISQGFDRAMTELGRIGAISSVFVFAPPHLDQSHLEIFYKHGFLTISCPKVKEKNTDRKIDTVDGTLIQTGRTFIDKWPEITHICIGSGDKDMAPLARYAIQQGKKVAIMCAEERSLADELIELAEPHPKQKGRKLIIPFVPLKKKS